MPNAKVSPVSAMGTAMQQRPAANSSLSIESLDARIWASSFSSTDLLRYSLRGKLLQFLLAEIGRAARRFSERKKQLPRSAGVRIARISLRNVYRTDGLCPARRGQYNYLVIDPPNNIGGFSDLLDERANKWGEPFRRS